MYLLEIGMEMLHGSQSRLIVATSFSALVFSLVISFFFPLCTSVPPHPFEGTLTIRLSLLASSIWLSVVESKHRPFSYSSLFPLNQSNKQTKQISGGSSSGLFSFPFVSSKSNLYCATASWLHKPWCFPLVFLHPLDRVHHGKTGSI